MHGILSHLAPWEHRSRTDQKTKELGTSHHAQNGLQAKERGVKLKIMIKVANWESIWANTLREFVSDSIFDCLVEFSVAMVVRVTLQCSMQDDIILKLLARIFYKVTYSWSSLRLLGGLYINSVSTREESRSSPAWARILRSTRLVSIEWTTRSILPCVSMYLMRKTRHIHC